MNTISEIEQAIEKLPSNKVDELAAWFEQFRLKRGTTPRVDTWLESARGAAIPGTTTESVLALTRGEE